MQQLKLATLNVVYNLGLGKSLPLCDSRAFLLGHAPRSNRRTDYYAEWLKPLFSAQRRSFWGSGWWVTPYGENARKLPKKGREYAVSSQNAKIYTSQYLLNYLLIQRTSDLRTEFRPRKAPHGWSAITPKQIQHDWRPPSWKSIWRHISAVDVPIWTKFDSWMQNNTPITGIWSTWKPDVEFQYGGRLFFKTGSSYISYMLTKFGLLIDIALLKAVASTNSKPEVVFSARHFEKWVWRHISAYFRNRK